jgi:predicted RNase H-related nuclease YkuK (DUF458 family)
MNWRKLGSGEQISLNEYLHDWLKVNEDHKIYVGCDSHNSGNKTTFAVAVVMHNPSKGGHVIYTKVTLPRMSSRYERLWKEVELSVETAQSMIDNGIQKPDYIDVDLNPDPKYQSNTLLRAAVGLIESMGMEARYKTLSPWAISIADTLCK